MKTQRFSHVFSTTLALAVALCAAVSPAFAQKKEVLQLQTQVQGLQDQMTQMKQSLDERMGALKNTL